MQDPLPALQAATASSPGNAPGAQRERHRFLSHFTGGDISGMQAVPAAAYSVKWLDGHPDRDHWLATRSQGWLLQGNSDLRRCGCLKNGLQILLISSTDVSISTVS